MNSETLSKIEELRKQAEQGEHPLLLGSDLGFLISGLMRAGEIGLYTAFQLNSQFLRLGEVGYTRPAYSDKPRISTCIGWLNQKLMAHVFEEDALAEQYKAHALKAYALNTEKRSHYILDRFPAFLDCQKDAALLGALSAVRKLDDPDSDEGPFHDEKFPFHYYSYEDELIKRLGGGQSSLSKEFESRFEDLLVALELAEY